MPTAIGSWFARDLVRGALALVEDGRAVLRVVEETRIEATVEDRGAQRTAVEWAGGTGPLALRAVCTCGGSGICAHVIATLETVRLQTESDAAPAAEEDQLAWLPAARVESQRRRARCVWPVFSSSDGVTLSAHLVLDSPRLKAAARDAASVITMMESTPLDDWDEADRELMRDDTVRDAFNGRPNPRALARALFRLLRHPRLRFDADPNAGHHPLDLPEFSIDPRGLELRATRRGPTFVPFFETVDGRRVAASDALLLDGPPLWIATRDAAYLADGSFDARAAIDAARAVNGAHPEPASSFSARTIVRVAPYLPADERAELGIVDASSPGTEASFAWADGALVARVAFVDTESGIRAAYHAHGAVAARNGGFVRFTAAEAARLHARFVGAGFVPRSSDAFALHGADRAASFLYDVLPSWTDIERKLDTSLLDLLGGKSNVDVGVSARRDGERADWFELRVDVFVGGSREALTEKELAALLASNDRFADVRGKLVDVRSLRERNLLLAELAERKTTGLAALLALRDELHENFTKVALPPEVEELREKLRAFEGIERVEPPALHEGALRGYQERGLDFLAYLAQFGFGGVLADDMGLGKTLELIAYLLWRKHRDGPSPSLVIAPTSVTHTWENEIARFAPELKTLRLHSGSDRSSRFDQVPNVDVVVTSYALARLDAERLAEHRFRTIVLDEAQQAKNPASQIARVVRTLRAEHRLALTGTPVENSLRDLWSIFAFVEPGLLGSETAFRRRFENPIAAGDEEVAATLRSRLEPFLLRRTKEDVLPELPARTEVVLECDLSPLQKRLYRGVAEAARRDVFEVVDRDGIENATVHVLAALTRLRQICAHPGLLFEEHRYEPEASAKFDAFLETVDEVLSGGHKVLVFSAFASMLRIVRTEFERRGLDFCYLDGSTKDRDRQGEVARFMSADGPPVFLCSLKAGGVGLTLTAADYVILYDPWWNPAVERQAIDRTHRIGQHRAVTAYRLVTVATVEEKIRELAARKLVLSANIVKADGTMAKSLTRADLEMLLADPPEG